MGSWNSEQYLRFAAERTRPAFELAQRVDVEAKRVIDLGCGPGNSTAVLAQRWPAAAVTGLDSSPEMLATAQRDHPGITWEDDDIAGWAHECGESFDVVFSNAALQWVPHHIELLPKLLDRVAPGGALAIQVPHTQDLPHQRRMRVLAASEPWASRFKHPPAAWQVGPVTAYYDALAPHARRTDLWLTEYAHVFDQVTGIVDWYRSTGLRPYLDALPEAQRAEFLADYLAAITPDHPPQADGKVLMHFRRLFVIAYR